MNEDSAVNSESKASQVYIALEVLCVFFWFLLDGFWLMEWKGLTYGFSALAIATACSMFWFIRKERVAVLIACADTCWLLLNILWAVGDLSKVASALVAARWLFLAGGLLCAAAFYCGDAKKRMEVLILSRVRVLRLFRGT